MPRASTDKWLRYLEQMRKRSGHHPLPAAEIRRDLPMPEVEDVVREIRASPPEIVKIAAEAGK